MCLCTHVLYLKGNNGQLYSYCADVTSSVEQYAYTCGHVDKTLRIFA